MRSRSALHLRSAAAATAAALALGLAACGDSDDSPNGGGGGAGADAASTDTSSSGSAAETGGSDRDRARATVEGLYAGLADRDAKAVCERLTPAMQKQFTKGGLAPKSGSCSTSFQKLLDKGTKEQFAAVGKAKVRSVEVTGDRAVATVGFGDDGRRGEIPLEKVDGEWKLAAAGATPAPPPPGK